LRIDIPCYGRFDGTVHTKGGKVYLKDKHGTVQWAFNGDDVGNIKIAACPRSGTMYITRLLGKLGYEIGHEKMGIDGSVGYHLAVVRPENCLHQIRHPLKQIASMIAHRSWGFSNKLVSVTDFKLQGCMELWLRLNELIEEFAVWRYQIEQLPDVWDEFCERIEYKGKMPDVPTDTNTCNRTKLLTWDDLRVCDGELAQAIYKKAVKYGYFPKGQEMPVVQDNLVA